VTNGQFRRPPKGQPTFQGADAIAFEKGYQRAKHGCPVSRVLRSKIRMEASLEAESKAAD